jgi:hypothetical protein
MADWYNFGGGGAIGNGTSMVRLRASSERFQSGRDYVFAVDEFGISDVEWSSTRELSIKFSQFEKPYRAESSWKNVSIRYEIDTTRKP